MSRKVYDLETRAAVMAALLTGQGVAEVAREYRLPKSTVSRWKAAAREGAGLSDDIGELLLGYMRENITTLTVQARHFRDPEWLHRWPAEQLAVLHGVLTDKAVRLLEAMEAPAAD
jgi:transposase-like protein